MAEHNAHANAEAKTAVDHASLPPELWLEIFRCATCVPRSRSIAPEDPLIPERPANYASGMNSPIESMRTKCTLVRVCRAWRVIGTELLYEHVLLNSARRAEALYRTLVETRKELRKEPDAGGAPGNKVVVDGPGHGQWVRHIEVHRWARSTHTNRYWQAIICIVSYCPRVRVFSGMWQEPLPSGFQPVLEHYLPRTLEELYWQQDSVLIAAKELPILTTPALNKFSALRVLDVRKICVLDAERSLQHVTLGPVVALPHVTHLALPTCPLLLRWASLQDLPALHHLILDAAGAPRTVYVPLVTKELNAFLEGHGPKLRTVELLPSNTQSLRPGPVSLAAFLTPNACPALETLVFDCRERVLSAAPGVLEQYTPRAEREPDPVHDEQPEAAPTASSTNTTTNANNGGTPAATATTPPRRASTPSVVDLALLHGGAPALPALAAPHPSLRRIGLRGASVSKLYPNRPAQAQAHLAAFATFRPLFPALEVVRTLGFLVGTSTDPFAPDVFIWWTERLERVGVDLQDGEGVVWLLEEPLAVKQAVAGSEKREELENSPEVTEATEEQKKTAEETRAQD